MGDELNWLWIICQALVLTELSLSVLLSESWLLFYFFPVSLNNTAFYEHVLHR
jgi:hypothetical protein